MRKSLILIGAVAIVILGIFLILVAAGRPAGPPITIRHVKSIPSGDTTTLIFEISNHTANSYVFFASAVEVHSGTAPSYRFPNNHPPRTLGPSSFITYPEAMIVPKGVPLRFRISANKRLTGPEGFVARVQLSIFFTIAGLPRPFSLNPFDNKGDVFGPSIGVDSEEFEESPKNQAER